MATSRDITSGNSYTGNSALGGRYSQGVTIDTTPLARLAAFTYYRDQNLWQQKQVDDKAAAKEIADMTAFDINSPMKGYAEHLKSKLNEIRDFVRENPNALSYNKDAKGFQKFKELENDFQNARKAANTSEVIYNARKTAADKAATPEEKDVLLSGLDLDVNRLFKDGIDGALNNTLNSAPELKPDTYTLPDIPLTKRISVVRNANDIQIDEIQYADPAQALAQADAVMFGFRKPIDKTTDRWKSLSPEEQIQEEKEYTVTSAPRLAIQKTTDNLNSLLQDLKAKNPEIKISDITPDMIPTETLGAVINSAKIYNENIDRLNAQTGEKYKHINLDDGVSGSEVLVLNAFQKNKNTLFSETEKKVQQTDNAIQDQQIKAANYRAQLNENGANYRANLPYEKLKLSASADAAKDFGNIIYGVNSNELKTVTGKRFVNRNGDKETLKVINGAIVGPEGNVAADVSGDFRVPASSFDNSIITEFNKYAGGVKTTSDGKVIEATAPSRLKKDEKGNFYTVKFENGIIKGILTDDGSYATDEQFQTITTQTSQKGATKYKKPEDISGGNKGLVPGLVQKLGPQGSYIQVVEKNGVKWGKKSDGTIERIP